MTKRNSDLSPRTNVVQALHEIDEKTGAVVPAISPASTFARDENYEPRQSYIYGRHGGPNSHHAEAIIASLENADNSLLFNSGQSAFAAVLEALPVGAHVIANNSMYHGGLHWLRRLEAQGKISVDLFPTGDLTALESKLRPDTAFVWIEVPSNPFWSVTDIKAASDLAHSVNACLMVDCTAAPPCTTQSLDMGADIAFHSVTKYLNGHSDMTGGVLSVRTPPPFWDQLQDIRYHQGTYLPAFESWLLIRGMRTLFVRFEQASKNAMAFAEYFANHTDVETVLYPGLSTHKGHSVAKQQMTNGFGGMMSILVKGPNTRAKAVAKACALFIPATSLGGVESLIEHRHTIEGDTNGVPENLLRISIGIEDVADLIADFEQALRASS